jgi:AraC-like DNA-binding protein
MNISKVQLYRKVKALIGTNINEYILNARLQKARYFLQHEDISVAEVAYRTGFSSPAYFSTVFKYKLGVSPTAFKGKR